MSKIIDFYNPEEKRKEERVKELRKQLAGVCWDMFPILEELKELNGLEMVLVDADGVWYQHNAEVVKGYKAAHAEQLEKIDKD